MHPYIQQHELNTISVQRSNLSFDEAVAVWLMHFEGEKQQIIAAKFGTNGGRIAEILTEKKHEGSERAARSLKFS
jgi:hypothetical protein